MLICKAKTITIGWWENVLKGISMGNTTIDYWTNNKIPDKRNRNIDIFEVYFEGDRVLAGSIIDTYKDTPHNIFKQFEKKPYVIGLTPDNCKEEEFERLLKVPFGLVPEQIGNIVFEVQFVSKNMLKAIMNYKSRDIELKIKEMPSKTEDKNKLNSGFVYENRQ